MNARTFGTDDKQAEFFERYGTASYEETGRAIAEAQRGISRDRLTGIEGVTREPQSRVFVDTPSDKAVNYLADLWLERSTKATREQVVTWAKQQDRRVVSDKIDWLKTQPKLNRPQAKASSDFDAIPAGRYAVTGDEGQTVFVRIDKPTDGQWKGYTFVKIQAGDDLHRVSRDTSFALQRKILADGVQEAMIRYGREIGSCGHCGRTLTNEESRAAGIGPVCRDKMGW